MMDFRRIFISIFSTLFITVAVQEDQSENTVTLSYCPTSSDESAIKNGAILVGATISCTCSSGINGTVQWFSPDGGKIGGATYVANLTKTFDSPVDGNFTCRNIYNGDEAHFRPNVAYGPTDADVSFRRRDVQQSSSNFVLSPDGGEVMILDCSVRVEAVWPFPLFRIHINLGDEEIIYHSVGSLTETNDTFQFIHEFRPDQIGRASLKCRAFNAIFQNEAFGEAIFDVAIRNSDENNNNTNTNPNPVDSSGESSGGATMGIGIGIGAAVVVVIIICVIAFLVLKKKRRKADHSRTLGREGIAGPYIYNNHDANSVSTGTMYGRSMGSVSTGMTSVTSNTRSNVSGNTYSSWAPSGMPFESARNLYSLPDRSDTASETNTYDDPRLYEILPEDLVKDEKHTENPDSSQPPRVSRELSKEDQDVGYFQPI